MKLSTEPFIDFLRRLMGAPPLRTPATPVSTLGSRDWFKEISVPALKPLPGPDVKRTPLDAIGPQSIAAHPDAVADIIRSQRGG